MYTIQLLNGDENRLTDLREALLKRIAKDGRFRVGVVGHSISNVGRREAREHNIPHDKRCNVPTLYLQRIRLVKKKPYCGNHPGECVVNPFVGPRKKPNATYLEWDDWVAFHNLVNGLLNQRHVRALIWTLPQDVKGKMWIRKGLQARRRWDYEDDYSRNTVVPIRIWNQGTPDQFESP